MILCSWHISLGGGMVTSETLIPIEQYRAQVAGKQCGAPSGCKGVFTATVELVMDYDPDGYWVAGKNEPQVIVAVCGEKQCGYQTHIWRLGVPGIGQPTLEAIAQGKVKQAAYDAAAVAKATQPVLPPQPAQKRRIAPIRGSAPGQRAN